MADDDTQIVAPQAAEQSNDDMTLATTNMEVAAPTEKKIKKVVRRKKRPARVQVDPSAITSEGPPQTGTIFNIWYGKWSGGDTDQYSQTAAKGRCNISKDAGYTKADSRPGSFFCVRFAQGLCPNGADCDKLHRLPGTYDLFGPNVDCFGKFLQKELESIG